MQAQAIKCPGCGAYIQLVEGLEVQFCQYCGTKIFTPKAGDTNINYSYRGDDVNVGSDFFGIGRAASSYHSAKENKKRMEHEQLMEMLKQDREEEAYLRAHPEERKRKDREFFIAFGIFFLFALFILGLGLLFGYMKK